MDFKDVHEQTRTYIYPNNEQLTVAGVVKVGIAPSGGHRLELTDGSKMIPRNGWLGIKLDAPSWSF